jgi:shikimate kinase
MSGPRLANDVLKDEIVSLIGYRGCGKTVVGRLLAERLSWEFVDTDALVEQQAGKTIQEIFATEGEVAFRKLEAATLIGVLAGRRRVVAAGGGAVLSRRCRKALRNTGVCVWLTAPPDVLLQRVEADPRTVTQRPQLTAEEGIAEIEAVLQARLPAYEATADQVVSTAECSVEQVVDTILAHLADRAHSGEPH